MSPSAALGSYAPSDSILIPADTSLESGDVADSPLNIGAMFFAAGLFGSACGIFAFSFYVLSFFFGV